MQGGRPLIEHQAIATKLAEFAIRLEVARDAVWQAAWASDHPEAVADRSLSDLPLTTIAQVFASEAVMKAAKDCGRNLRRHGRDARHAAGEIHPRRPRLSALAATAIPTPSCASRKSSPATGAPDKRAMALAGE